MVNQALEMYGKQRPVRSAPASPQGPMACAPHPAEADDQMPPPPAPLFTVFGSQTSLPALQHLSSSMSDVASSHGSSTPPAVPAESTSDNGDHDDGDDVVFMGASSLPSLPAVAPAPGASGARPAATMYLDTNWCD